MIYLAVVIIAVCIFIIYKERGVTRYFLFLLCIGCLISLLTFMVYLHYLKERQLYLYMFWKILYMRDFISDATFLFGFNMMFTITLMNLGVLLFIYSCICFSVSFIRPQKPNKRIYLILAISPVVQFIIYCPWVYDMVYRYLLTGPYSNQFNSGHFFRIEEIIYYITSVINQSYLGLSIILIIYYYFKTPRLKYFRSYAMFILAGLVSVVLLYYTMFWWAPKRLISVTTLTDYIHILPVSLFLEGKMLTLFPYVALISMVLLIYAIFRFNSTYLGIKNIGNSIVSSIDVSSVGIRFFTHMIKNCAMATVMDAESLKGKLNSGGDCTEYIDRIINSNKELLDRLNEIKLKFSRISIDLELTEINLPIDNALKQVNLEGINLVYKKAPENCAVLMDSKHMSEVILNIINNAVYAMKESEKILTIEALQEKFWVVISISDTGEGIEKESLNKIFVPFYTTKNKKYNWGLGLSYCYKVVNAHKGKIFVESSIGKGTTFKILLPQIQ